MRLSRHRLCQQGLTRSGRSHKQGSLGQPRAYLGILSGIVQEINHLHQGFLGLVLACHVLKGHARFLLHIDLGIALAHAHRTAAAAHLFKDDAQQYPHQRNRQHHIEHHIHNSAGIVVQRPVGIDSVLYHARRQGIKILHHNGGISHLYISVKRRIRIGRHGAGLIPFLQGKTDLPVALHVDGLYPVFVDVFQKLRIGYLSGVSAAAEQHVPQHKNN